MYTNEKELEELLETRDYIEEEDFVGDELGFDFDGFKIGHEG